MREHRLRRFFAAVCVPQRQGIGTQFLTFMLTQTANSGSPLYLETDKISNVQLYKRFGFSVLAQPSLQLGEV